jgi:hypothetical protein
MRNTPEILIFHVFPLNFQFSPARKSQIVAPSALLVSQIILQEEKGEGGGGGKKKRGSESKIFLAKKKAVSLSRPEKNISLKREVEYPGKKKKKQNKKKMRKDVDL